jgi:transcriptional repressor NrdR
MHCPFCQHENTQVLDTRYQENENIIKRKRKCESCNAKFTTFETVHLSFPSILKRDGTRESYQRSKIEKSMLIALRKRPISLPELDNAIKNIEAKILAIPEREVPSKQIGIIMLDILKSIDKIAYIRFASVYQNFENVNDFNNLIIDLHEK